jgi:diguanylate cyclase (GGDEF)-like protein
MAGGVVCIAAYTPAMFAFILPTVLPVIACLALRGGVVRIEMAGMLTLFTAALTLTGRSLNRSIIENLRLRIGQDNLLEKLVLSEAAMSEAQEMAHVGSWSIDVRTEKDIWSKETYRIFGVDPARFTPSLDAVLARIPPKDRPAIGKHLLEMRAGGMESGLDHRLMMDDGAIKYVHELARATFSASGQLVRISGTVQDVTERRIAEDKLQLANVLLKTEMEASPEGILVVDANRRVISFNMRFAKMWNIPPEELANGTLDSTLARATSLFKDSQKLVERVDFLLEHPCENHCEEYETNEGKMIKPSVVTLVSAAGQYLGRAWFFRDVTESRQAEALALRMAHFDILTGLANRSVFVEELSLHIARAERGKEGFAVIYLDLDRFKDVNDTLGHSVGDGLLQAVAQRLKSITRSSDTVARFGGDEFAVVVGDLREPAEAAVLADNLISALGKPYSIHGNEIYSSASIGIDFYGTDASDVESLLSHADIALYRAKSEGRNSYRFFTDAMDKEVRMQVSLGTELHHALDSDELFLVYQPQVTSDGGQIIGVEALLRWRHPTRGILSPGIFIPIAEKTGIMVRLGQWVLLTACQQAKAWLDSGITSIRTCVNLSAIQFQSPIALETFVASVLLETGLPPQLLELELTETVLMNASLEHRDIVPRLRQIGVTIAIDDFGTGYSSLDYLRLYPADRIKIDQSFVRHLGTNSGDAAIVKAIIGLAHELGIAVIAEGIETSKQLDLLRSWGCLEVQGFYFARPLAARDVTLLLRQGSIVRSTTYSTGEGSADRKLSPGALVPTA